VTQEIRKVAEAVVRDGARGALEDEEPRRVTRARRLLGDELGRQWVVVGLEPEGLFGHGGAAASTWLAWWSRRGE